MFWKIIFLLVCFNVIVKAGQCIGKSTQYVPIKANTLEEYLEELYHVNVVRSLNSMPTLDETDVIFDDNDVRLLTTECYPDENCLNEKRASVKKYRQKMQAIQCIHGLFVLKVLDELKAIVRRSPQELKDDDSRDPFWKQRVYLKSMLSLLNMAKWDAYSWQIEIFAFVEGLAASDTDLEKYKEHFLANIKSMCEKPSVFISQCVQDKYLLCGGDTTSDASTISGLVDGVYPKLRSLYKSGVLDIHRQLRLYTVKNLILSHLYRCHGFIFNWPMYGIGLEMSNVKRELAENVALYASQELCHKWELDPISANKYNSLILDCIHLKLVQFVWVHLHAYSTLKKRPSDGNARLFRIWNTLVSTLKDAIRLFRFEENIYWSAIHIMMDDLNSVSKTELAAREEFTRNYFCKAAEDLGLASASDIDRQLKNLKALEDLELTYKRIEDNSDTLNMYIFNINLALRPVDGTFVRMIVTAEGNETFVMH